MDVGFQSFEKRSGAGGSVGACSTGLGRGRGFPQGRLGGHPVQPLQRQDRHHLPGGRQLGVQAGRLLAAAGDFADAHGGLHSRRRLDRGQQECPPAPFPALSGEGLGRGQRGIPPGQGFAGSGRRGGLPLRPALGHPERRQVQLRHRQDRAHRKVGGGPPFPDYRDAAGFLESGPALSWQGGAQGGRHRELVRDHRCR